MNPFLGADPAPGLPPVCRLFGSNLVAEPMGSSLTKKPMLATFFYNPQESRQIQNDLIQAGEALGRDQETPDFCSAAVYRHDELGAVIGAFRPMYRRIADAVNNRKKAGIACRKALSRLKPIPGCLTMNRKKAARCKLIFCPSSIADSLRMHIGDAEQFDDITLPAIRRIP